MLRHAPNRARRLILGDHDGAGAGEGFGAVEAVGSHSSQDDRERGGAEHRRGVAEEDVHGGAAEIHGRPVVEADHRTLRSIAREAHMAPARRHIDPARKRAPRLP